jgi:hypothetical protein
MSHLKQMAMLALNHAILSVSSRIGELRLLLSEKISQGLGDILLSRVSPKQTNTWGELSVNHDSNILIYRENLAAISHKVKPRVVREAINKYNIILMPPPSK